MVAFVPAVTSRLEEESSMVEVPFATAGAATFTVRLVSPDGSSPVAYNDSVYEPVATDDETLTVITPLYVGSPVATLNEADIPEEDLYSMFVPHVVPEVSLTV